MLLTNYLAGITAFIACYYSFSFLRIIFRNTLNPYLYSKRKEIKKFGNWIVITGATDGIGKAFAELLAKDGYNLVLISRTDEKLRKVKSDLMAEYNVKINIITADFTKFNIYDKIKDSLEGLEIGLLINNVGMSYQYPSELVGHKVTNELANNILNCNDLSVVLMTKVILSLGMLSRGGFILNISSGFGSIVSPFLSIYGASKSFVNSFTFSLQSELRSSQVTMQLVEPYMVSTNMSKAKVGLMVPSAISFANSVLNRLGTCSRTNGCFIHELQAWVVKLLPDFVVEKIVYSTMLGMRKKSLKKLAKQAEYTD